jgi:hypothetical protein
MGLFYLEEIAVVGDVSVARIGFVTCNGACMIVSLSHYMSFEFLPSLSHNTILVQKRGNLNPNSCRPSKIYLI